VFRLEFRESLGDLGMWILPLDPTGGESREPASPGLTRSLGLRIRWSYGHMVMIMLMLMLMRLFRRMLTIKVTVKLMVIVVIIAVII